MKYFTFDWWSGLHEDETAASRYGAYLDSVRGRLPPAIQRFHEGCTLHDSEVIELRVEPVEARAVLSLAGSNLDGGPCDYRLEGEGSARARMFNRI
jgi:hypothetical protein